MTVVYRQYSHGMFIRNLADRRMVLHDSSKLVIRVLTGRYMGYVNWIRLVLTSMNSRGVSHSSLVGALWLVSRSRGNRSRMFCSDSHVLVAKNMVDAVKA